ncbi:ER membrane glycoprotein subunit of the GPI transamidase complex-like protein [Elasticomyces elasticus]|nr:ER membrane glycoprotein subunit of the GPI transamidase complex-like protein [Elasticomyces elasticus]KAK4957808.1 hypothetical protein LTR28_005613 [Elasticomyces elasticus]
MSGSTAKPRLTSSPVATLCSVFAVWKLLLIVIACASPGPGYDTSTQLFFHTRSLPGAYDDHRQLPLLAERLIGRLTRWDAIYFTAVAHRGHVYEQEYAFSYNLRAIAQVFSLSDHPSPAACALTGILVSHLFHLLSTFVLFLLALQIAPSQSYEGRCRIALLTGLLHIFSPAGIFLSAPYSESMFAFWNFLGMLCFARSCRPKPNGVEGSIYTLARRDLYILISGLAFALASRIRSNGVFSSLVFAFDLALAVPRLPQALTSFVEVRRLSALAIAGLVTASGMVIPQALAWAEYCGSAVEKGRERRPWCDARPPSIYAWVQKILLTLTGLAPFLNPTILQIPPPDHPTKTHPANTGAASTLQPNNSSPSSKDEQQQQQQRHVENAYTSHCLRRLAIPQLILSLTALTQSHVQIINRLASGYPVWYLVLATAITNANNEADDSAVRPTRGAVGSRNDNTTTATTVSQTSSALVRKIASLTRSEKALEWTFRAMVMYAVVQAGLFASFMPPA